MSDNQAIGRAVRARLSNPELRKEIQHTLKVSEAGRPLDAEPDMTRRVRRVQAITGMSEQLAEEVANYADPATLDLTRAQRSGAESIQGKTVDFLGSSFLTKGAMASRAACRIAFRDGIGEGTGFLISDRLLITNNHVIPTERAARDFLAEFDYELGLDRRPKPVTKFELDPATFFVTSDRDDLDFTIVAVGARFSGQAELAQLGYCGLSAAPDKHSIGEFANLVQHPDARMKEIVVRESQIVARGQFALHYLADTEPGSSGSPVYNDQWEVIALHHWGVPHREVKLPDGTPIPRDVNEGIRVSAIIAELQRVIPRMPAAHQALMNAALRLGAEDRYSLPTTVTKPHTDGSESNASASLANANSARTINEDWSITLLFPLSVTVAFKEPFAEKARVRSDDIVLDENRALAELPTGIEKVKPARDYRNRAGFQKTDFLPGFDIDMPHLSPAQEEIAARNLYAASGSDQFEISYTHFSVKMHGGRRLAFFTATNIDGTSWKSINRQTGKITPFVPRQESIEQEGPEARETWYEDPRVHDNQETADTLYIGQTIGGQRIDQLRMFERGHLTRRQDPSWGSDEDALAADADTFHFTNCTPQIGFFNEGKSKVSGEEGRGKSASGTLHWRAIEDYVLENAKAEQLRVCVFTGPVLDDANDLPWRTHVIPDFKVPRQFWKVVVRVEDRKLLATALCADQGLLIDEMPERRAGGYADLSKVRKYQVSIEELERLTGLDFGAEVRGADTFRAGGEARSKALSEIGDVILDLQAPASGSENRPRAAPTRTPRKH
ncbi:DNA/RNA non-specific endonuclease [Rhizobium leguminosarum]|uniref:DNA/RNA non-specific endonuclease n=1 Tax=Rhizobium leguminosarum TaxID=384 RepID=UPI0013D62A95|nr:DNA/RNA non-specific endonuclease [Rhizobium leguminosarum]